MNEIEFLDTILRKQGYEVNKRNRQELLTESETVYEQIENNSDHYVDTCYVVELEGRYIEFSDGRAKDDSPYEFYWSSVRFVEKVTKTVIVYE